VAGRQQAQGQGAAEELQHAPRDGLGATRIWPACIPRKVPPSADVHSRIDLNHAMHPPIAADPRLDGPFCSSKGKDTDAEAIAVPFVAVATVGQTEARRTAVGAITSGVLRPEDIDSAVIGRTALVYVPFWRMELDVASEHLRIAGHVKAGGLSLPIPLPSKSHKQSELLVMAHSTFPFTPKLSERSTTRSSGGTSHVAFAWRSLRIRQDELTPREQVPALAGEIVMPDVTKEEASAQAKHRAVTLAMPHHAYLSSYDPAVRKATLVHYPLYVTCYRYDGHARTAPGERYWVLLSGRSGTIVGSHHPSAFRSVARKLRSLLSFG
jgi:hypothetical protein